MLVLLAMAAFAQDGGTFDAHGFNQAPGTGSPLDTLSTWRPGTPIKGSWGASGLFEYADSPLVLVTEDASGQTTGVVVDNLAVVNLAGRYAPTDWLAITATAPVYLSALGPTANKGLGMGDIRLSAPFVAVGRADGEDGTALSVIPFIALPSGATSRFLGVGGLAGGLTIATGWTHGDLSIDGNAGVDAAPNLTYANLHGGTKVILAAAVGYRLSDVIGVHAEANIRPALQANTVPWTETPGEALFSVRAKHPGGFGWTVGASVPYTRGATAAAFRVFAGIGYSVGQAVVVVSDVDGDGFPDDEDICPAEPETQNGFADLDGCPDELANVVVTVRDEDGKAVTDAHVVLGGKDATTDGDGHARFDGLMPGTPLAGTVEHAGYTTRAVTDFTADEGLSERTITLVAVPGRVKVIARIEGGGPVDATVAFAGPVRKDTVTTGPDGVEEFDLRPGPWKLIASADGYGAVGREVAVVSGADAEAVIEFDLKPTRTVVKATEIQILDQVLFDYDKDTIMAASLPLLTEVANVLIEHPEILKVEVQGHTDDKGNDAYNKELSQRRVNSVVTFLVSQGVDINRLVPVGYGEEKPIASNKTDKGRALNRRVQFMILDPAPPAPAPAPGSTPAPTPAPAPAPAPAPK